MSAISHGWRPSGLDIPVKVAREFHAADKGSKWGAEGKAEGGGTDGGTSDWSRRINYALGKLNLRDIYRWSQDPHMSMRADAERSRGVSDAVLPRSWNDTDHGHLYPGYAAGGFLSPPWYERVAGRQMRQNQFSGFANSPVPGRTDRHRVGVGAGAYIVPADSVSAIGQGNSIAGGSILKKMFSAGSRFGLRAKTPGFAEGGEVSEPVDAVIAGGEFAIPPDAVQRLGGGDMDKGHKILDAWVMAVRQKHIETLKKLPPPKK